MNLSWIDWTILAVAVISLRFVSLSTKRYMRGVADFLSANRSAGRYLLTIAGAMGTTATISIAAQWEMYYSAGLPPVWWGFMNWAATAVILLTGWVFYRFRETRALTLAQFFEMRYSRRFRIFAGILAWTCGVLNFGVFPAVAARFIMYFCGLPECFHIPGVPFAIPTFPAVMAVDLGIALMFVTMGGQISVMVTDCVQGMISSVAMLVVVGSIMMQVQWPRIVEALEMAPEHASMLDPYMTSMVKDFNIWFFLIGIFGTFYCWMAWQGTSGFNSSARSPHEQKMGGIIGIWRGFPQALLLIVAPIAALAVMRLPEYSAQAAAVNAAASTITNDAVRSWMQVPMVMAQILPIGVKGLLATVMIFFSFTCHDTYMHSWGSIFIQDVVVPIRNRPLAPAQHIRILRWSVIGVAVFAFCFGLLYQPTQKIMFFFAITGTIWLGGAGACIIGGLYWRKGTTAAAYSALIVGAVVGFGGLVVRGMYQNAFGRDFPINDQYLWFMAMMGAIAVYVVVSLLSSRKDFDLNRMLHRGRYALPAVAPIQSRPVSRWRQFVGITEEFSPADRVLAVALIVWNCGWSASVAVGTILHYTLGLPEGWWPGFWRFYILIQLAIGVLSTVWFTVGGIIDIKGLFRTLATAIRDDTDDGRVKPEGDDIHHIDETAVGSAAQTDPAQREV